MIYEIAIRTKKGFSNSHNVSLLNDIKIMGIDGVENVEYFPVYRIISDIDDKKVSVIANELLTDRITEEFSISKYKTSEEKETEKNSIEVWLKHGVTDTVSESVVKAIKDLGITDNVIVKTGHKYCFNGSGITVEKLNKIAKGFLANTLIQEYKIR
ncbi:phosphoribosylformylglycinamidine synthase subunit PurS [Candidatus Ruminimicrobium bovinum]|uniref:phosphoribosylformylglycinamidine synthase subunit PurS n=1 Tax=Candidatus Ruminimicrobium bovinum TaxID=3242779 RepID=UPI0039B883FD